MDYDLSLIAWDGCKFILRVVHIKDLASIDKNMWGPYACTCKISPRCRLEATASWDYGSPAHCTSEISNSDILSLVPTGGQMYGGPARSRLNSFLRHHHNDDGSFGLLFPIFAIRLPSLIYQVLRRIF